MYSLLLAFLYYIVIVVAVSIIPMQRSVSGDPNLLLSILRVQRDAVRFVGWGFLMVGKGARSSFSFVLLLMIFVQPVNNGRKVIGQE